MLNKKAEALLAFKISTKGAIRQAPSAITWFITLANLSRYGVTDPSAVIAEWNSSNGRTSALVGGKAMAVKLLLEKAPKTCANFLIQHVGAWGWNNCAFSDDGLASKKIYPGYCWKHQKPGWADRNQVTDRSMLIHLRASVQDFEGKPAFARRKINRKDMEDFSEMSAFVESIFQEVKRSTNIKEDIVQMVLVDAFVEQKDTELLLELNSLLSEKPEKISFERISVIKTALLDHSLTSPIQISTLSMTQDLEQNEFNCTRCAIEHDVQATIVFDKKQNNFEKATYWKKLEWRSAENAKIATAVKAFVESCSDLVPYTTTPQMMRDWIEWKKQTVEKSFKVSHDQVAPRPNPVRTG